MNGNVNGLNGNNINVTNMNASNTVSAKYSQMGGVLDAAQAMAAGKKAGKEWSKAFTQELNKQLKAGLGDFKVLDKQLNEVKTKFELAAADIKAQFGTGKNGALSGDALKEYNNYVKETQKTIEGLTKTSKALNEETKKAEPNTKILIELSKKKAEEEEAVNKLLSTQELKLKEIELLQRQKTALDAASKKENDAERQKAKKDYDEISKQLLEVRQQLLNIDDALEESADKLDKKFDGVNSKLSLTLSNIKSGITTLSDTIGTVSTAVNSFFDFSSTDKQIQLWDRSLDRYTQMRIDLNNSFGNLSSFESFKNNVISNQPSGLYNSDQMMSLMSDLRTYSFKNTEIAEAMSKDLAFAKEYMGVSNENLHGLYELQVRTGQDDFLKKSLNNITGLQKSGIAISQEQLNHEIESSKTLTDKLLDMGMDTSAVERVMSQLTNAQAQADTIYGPGAGDRLMEMVESSLSTDNIGMMTNNPYGSLNALRSGDVSTYLKDLMNSPLSKAANNVNMSDPINGMIASADGGIINGTDNLMRYFAGDSGKMNNFFSGLDSLNKTTAESTEDTKSLDETIKEITEALPDKIKEGNVRSEELMLLNWKTTADQMAIEKDAQSHMTRINQTLNLANATITAAIGVMAMLSAAINANTVAQGGSSIKNLFSKGGSKIGSDLTSLSNIGLAGAKSKLGGTALGKGMSSLGMGSGTIGGGLVAGAGITAGVVATGSMIKDGFTGLTDKDGNQVGKSAGDRAAAVFGGSELKEAGKNKGASAGNGALKGAGVGAMIGTFVGGPVGTAVGGAIGAGVGALAGLIAGNHKDNKARELERKKREERMIEIQESTKKATEAIKNQRDVALMTRYSDSRFGTGGPSESFATAAPYIAPSTDKDELPHGGTENGVDIDGWTKTAGWPTYSNGSAHSGMDFAKSHNHPIGAAFAGEVIRVGNNGQVANGNRNTPGNYVQVYHPERDITATYYHMSSTNTKVGDMVNAGDTIGFQGNTGHCEPYPGKYPGAGPTAGSHLHYEIHPGKTGALGSGSLNPANYLSPHIFYANGKAPEGAQASSSSDSSSNSSGTKSKYSYNASVVRSSTIPVTRGYGGPTESDNTVSSFSSKGIEEKLDTINNTLLAMDERQNKQERILNALSNNPIHNFGV